MSETYGLTTMKNEHFKHNPNTIQKIDGKWINVKYASGGEYRYRGRKVIDIFGRFKKESSK